MNFCWKIHFCLKIDILLLKNFNFLKYNLIKAENDKFLYLYDLKIPLVKITNLKKFLFQDQARSFVTHWTKGSPEEVSLTCQIVGTDPTFGFARVCDETQPVKIFKQTAQHQQAVSFRIKNQISQFFTPVIIHDIINDARATIKIRLYGKGEKMAWGFSLNDLNWVGKFFEWYLRVY